MSGFEGENPVKNGRTDEQTPLTPSESFKRKLTNNPSSLSHRSNTSTQARHRMQVGLGTSPRGGGGVLFCNESWI